MVVDQSGEKSGMTLTGREMSSLIGQLRLHGVKVGVTLVTRFGHILTEILIDGTWKMWPEDNSYCIKVLGHDVEIVGDPTDDLVWLKMSLPTPKPWQSSLTTY
jgi:hypothetical protein